MINMVVWRLYAGVIYFILLFLKCLGERRCNGTDLSLTSTQSQCFETEFCDERSNSCQCLQGYVRTNATTCIPDTHISEHSTPNYLSLVDNQGNGSLLAGILIPVFLIIFVICTIYLNKKYELVKWLRQKIYQRNENYDEFMIGQDLEDDDPPLR